MSQIRFKKKKEYKSCIIPFRCTERQLNIIKQKKCDCNCNGKPIGNSDRLLHSLR